MRTDRGSVSVSLGIGRLKISFQRHCELTQNMVYIPTAGRDVYRGIYGFDMRLRPTYVSAERAEGALAGRQAGAGLSIRRAVEQK